MPNDHQNWTLPTRFIGANVRVYDCIDSTNTLALALAEEPAHDGLVILTREQSAGRGQYGRSWHAPPGSSVLMSLLLFPPPNLRRPAILTAWAAVAVCETIAELTGQNATIKWPNDVLLDGKKICGILIEQRTTKNADFSLASVVGIGLNVSQTAAMFEQAELPLATSLARATGREFSFEDVARKLIRQLDWHYDLLHDGQQRVLEKKWQVRLGVLDHTVVMECIQEVLRGRLIEASFAGLNLEIADGRVLRVPPESVRHLRLAE